MFYAVLFDVFTGFMSCPRVSCTAAECHSLCGTLKGEHVMNR